MGRLSCFFSLQLTDEGAGVRVYVSGVHKRVVSKRVVLAGVPLYRNLDGGSSALVIGF